MHVIILHLTESLKITLSNYTCKKESHWDHTNVCIRVNIYVQAKTIQFIVLYILLVIGAYLQSSNDFLEEFLLKIPCRTTLNEDLYYVIVVKIFFKYYLRLK